MSKRNTLNSWGNLPEWAYASTKAILTSLKQSDSLTYSHCLRVGEYSRKLARDSGLNEYEQKLSEFAGLLHDVGKMGVEKSILHKPARLTEIEMDHMKAHPVLSEEIVKPLIFEEFFASILPGIRGHHERIDGQGYPDKLSGDKIPLLSRIVLIVDTLDAMGEDRSYRKGLPIDIIYKELAKFAGVQFDPQLVKIFLEAHPHWQKEASDLETAEKIIKRAA